MARLIGRSRSSTHVVLWSIAMIATAAFGVAAYWALTQLARLLG
jgi:hypothetical protein